MTAEELKRACVNLRGAGLDFALLTSHENVAYVSGFDEPLPVGAPRDFSGGFPLSLVVINAREETGTLLAADTYKGLASAQSLLGAPVTFSIFDSFSAVDPVQSFVNAVRDALQNAGLGGRSRGKIGVELETTPAVLARLLASDFRSVTVSDARPSLEKARMTKTSREIQLLRKTAMVADAGQRALVTAAASFTGATEFEVWAAVSTAVMEAAAAPAPVPLVGELVTGPRTCEVKYPGGPRQRRIEAGDTGILDISVRVDGYWSDCCNTVVFGREPGEDQKRYYKASKDGFEAAVGALKPGARCSDIDAAVRGAFKRNGFGVAHYSGHQIGATVNERPRVVSYDPTPVEPGMVFCFEPGVYAGPGGATGARLERMVLVTESGSEVLNQFPWGMG
jgi:Xaa-Pro dipeptidase